MKPEPDRERSQQSPSELLGQFRNRHWTHVRRRNTTHQSTNVGAGSEALPYFQNNKKTKLNVISAQMPAQLIFVTKSAFNGTF